MPIRVAMYRFPWAHSLVGSRDGAWLARDGRLRYLAPPHGEGVQVGRLLLVFLVTPLFPRRLVGPR